LEGRRNGDDHELAARLAAVLARYTGITSLTDEQGRIVWGTERARRAATDTTVRAQSIHPDDLAAMSDAYHRARAQPGVPQHHEYRLWREGEGWRDMRAAFTNLLHEPAIAAIVHEAFDGTERTALDHQHRTTESRLGDILALTSDMVVVIDDATYIRYASAVSERLLGYRPSDLTGRLALDLVHADDVAMALEALQATIDEDLQPSLAAPVRLRVQHADGRWIWTEITANNLLDDPDVRGIVLSVRDVTEAVRLEEERRQTDEVLHSVVANSSDIIAVVAPDDRLSFVSSAVTTVLGHAPEEMIGRDAMEFVHPEDGDLVARAVSGESSGVRLRLLHADGHYVWVEAVGNALPDGRGFVVNVRDLTESRRLEADLRKAEVMFEQGFERAPIGMLMVDADARILRFNPAFAQMLGRSPHELVGRTTYSLGHPDDNAKAREELRRLFEGEEDRIQFERRYRHGDGHWVWTRVTASVVHDEDGIPRHTISQVEDITEQKHLLARLEFDATHDLLTGLPGRVLILDHLELALAAARRSGGSVAVLFIDLDNFKHVNDSFGHAAGDELLVSVARRLRAAVRAVDTAGRLSGDEFVVVAPDLASAHDAIPIAERIRQLLGEPFVVRGAEIYISASIGIATSEAGSDAATLLRESDTAAYRAKDNGRDRVEVFDDVLRDAVALRSETESALRRALDRDEILVHYQPIVVAQPVDGAYELRGFEALVRWAHPERGLVAPAEFLDVAERTGLVNPIGAIVLDSALAQLAAWRRVPPPSGSLRVSVNLSPVQLAHTGLVDTLVAAVQAHDLAPADCIVEITETAVMRDTPTALATLRTLRELGFPVALDDFGTGYSSLSWLQLLPATLLKIDRTFVEQLDRSEQARTIVRSIIDLAHGLGMTVTAEGVHTRAVAALCTELGCDRLQGFWFSPGLPPADAAALVEAGWVVPID
jgi:diguanylate cyclase (GGDEF)-like protein/PAS domain S-box-containing protein